jgi:hypothetical protein
LASAVEAPYSALVSVPTWLIDRSKTAAGFDSIGAYLPWHPILYRMRLDHPDDHPDDPSASVGSRLDRQRIQREQPKSVWNRPGRRRASDS